MKEQIVVNENRWYWAIYKYSKKEVEAIHVIERDGILVVEFGDTTVSLNNFTIIEELTPPAYKAE
jgi:hypothetical protein